MFSWAHFGYSLCGVSLPPCFSVQVEYGCRGGPTTNETVNNHTEVGGIKTLGEDRIQTSGVGPAYYVPAVIATSTEAPTGYLLKQV